MPKFTSEQVVRLAAVAAAALLLALAACGGGGEGGTGSSDSVKSLRVLDYYNNEPDKTRLHQRSSTLCAKTEGPDHPARGGPPATR